MKTIDYDAKDSASTENQIATDEMIKKNEYENLQHAYNEGFAASDGVRGETAETDGRVVATENSDDSHPKRVPDSIESENPGLADN